MIETKTYADGTVVTSAAPLPDKSPAEQDEIDAPLKAKAGPPPDKDQTDKP